MKSLIFTLAILFTLFAAAQQGTDSEVKIKKVNLEKIQLEEDFELELDTMYFTGKYKGKNLLVKNQFSDNDKEFSVKSIILNEDVVVHDLNAPALEIDLSTGNRKVGDDLNIAIIYLKGKSPEILNFQDIE